MKRLTAILLSLLLLWVQFIVMAPPAQSGAPARCRCCSCGTGECCVGKSAPSDSAPLPVAPVQTAQLGQNLFTFTASPAWLLPAGEAEVFSAVSASPLSAARVPLFQRNCALLI
jgi:hypothetical protein